MRKLFSFMGTGGYKEVSYFIKDGKQPPLKTRFVQEAIIEHLMQDGDLTVYFFLTKEAKAINYNGGKTDDYDQLVTGFQEIQKRLEEKYPQKLTFEIVEDMVQGKNPDEIWEIFYQITNHLQKKDKVYVDITHAFRSLPFLMTGILNYASFCHSALKVEEIFYGVYEKDAETVPILLLSEYIRLQEWTAAVDKCLSGGQSEICDLIRTQIKQLEKRENLKDPVLNAIEKNLRSYLESLKTCRVKENIKAALALKEDFEQLDGYDQNNMKFKELKPFFYILQKLKIMVEDYRENDLINNTHEMTKQCMTFGMYQQVFVLIRENIVNCLMVNMVKKEADYYDYREREQVLNNYKRIAREGTRNVSNGDYYYQNIPSHFLKENALRFYRNGNRNDVSHAGMEKNAMASEEIISEAQRNINQFDGLFLKFLPERGDAG